jgi:hypothetical protein
MRAEMIEIHAEGVRIAPEVAPVDVQPERTWPQFGETVRLTGKTNDDVRFEAVDVARHHLGDDAERRMIGILGLICDAVQSGGKFAQRSYSSIQ